MCKLYFSFTARPGRRPRSSSGSPRHPPSTPLGLPPTATGASPLRDREGEERHRWRGAGAAGLRELAARADGGAGGIRGEREAARTAAWSSGAGDSGGAQALPRTAGMELARRARGELVARADGGARGAGQAKRSGFLANTARPRSGFRKNGKAGGRVRQPRHAVPGGASAQPGRRKSLEHPVGGCQRSWLECIGGGKDTPGGEREWLAGRNMRCEGEI
jgi:hypothetical protein